MRNWIVALLGAISVLPFLADTGVAQPRREEQRREERRFEERRAEERFRDRDIRRFREHDIEVWRRGGWIHGRHNGRLGWWWVVNGNWYFYAAPVYPYPDPYVPPVVAAPAPGQYWYYCRNPRGYYPYIGSCAVPWQAVPAT